MQGRLALSLAAALACALGNAGLVRGDAAGTARPVAPVAKPATAANAAPHPLVGHSAVMDVASGLAASLPRFEGRVLVGVAPLAADMPAPRGKALSVTLARVFAGQRQLEAPTEPESMEAFRARGRAARILVYLSPRIVNGDLTVTAEAFPVPRTVWARLRNPSPAPFAHAFARASIDAEVRSHLDPVPLTGFEAVRGKALESGVLALLCQDLDGDGAPELVTVSQRSVVLARIRQGKVEPLAGHPWATLSGMAAAPLREPIAFVSSVIAGEGHDPVASITDRASSIRFDARLELRDKLSGLAIPDGDGIACARTAAITVTGPLAPCSPDGPPPRHASVGGRYDAFASAHLVTGDGKPFEVFAGREDGHLEVFDDVGHKTSGPSVGAQLAVGDLDQDGAPEILTSLDVMGAAPDALVISTWSRQDRRLREVVRMPLAAGVRAIATCPPDSARRPAFVVATGDELVVFR